MSSWVISAPADFINFAVTDTMCEEERLAIIQRQFDRLYDLSHPGGIETMIVDRSIHFVRNLSTEGEVR